MWSRDRVMIDLTRLNHVVVVARTGSFVKAATLLSLSQPALSRSIQATERHYQIRIFERGPSGVYLTSRGARFLAAAEEAVSRAEAAERDLRVVSAGMEGPVRFGLGPMSASLLIETLTQRAMVLGLRAAVRVESDAVLRQALQAGELEFYFGASTDSREFAAASRFLVSPVRSARITLLVRKDHALLERSQTDAHSDIGLYPVIGGSALRAFVDQDAWTAVGLSQPVLEIDNYDCLIRICQNTDAILVAAREFLHAGVPDLRELTPPVPLSPGKVTLRLVRFADHDLSPAAKAVADLVVQLYRELV
jgi:DNA-binding transcriptional LysR family regulator